MRVSAAGWLYDTVERTREVAKATANVSHNHPEGIKGAECTAAVIFLARTGATKEEIEKYVVNEFGYDFTETLDEMREVLELFDRIIRPREEKEDNVYEDMPAYIYDLLSFGLHIGTRYHMH